MTSESLIALLPMGELVAALRANGPDLLKGWLSGGVQDLTGASGEISPPVAPGHQIRAC